MYVKHTLADLRQSLADRHDSGIVPTSSQVISFWDRLINKGIAYCADRLRLNKETELTTVSGTIALPDDFIILNDVYVDGTPLTKVDASDLPSHEGFVYWITGNQSSGFYLNTPYDDTYTVDYSFKPEKLVNGTDVCVIPDPEAVVAYAYSMLRKSETDPIEDAEPAMQECDSRLKEMQDAYAINSNFQGFIIQ